MKPLQLMQIRCFVVEGTGFLWTSCCWAFAFAPHGQTQPDDRDSHHFREGGAQAELRLSRSGASSFDRNPNGLFVNTRGRHPKSQPQGREQCLSVKANARADNSDTVEMTLYAGMRRWTVLCLMLGVAFQTTCLSYVALCYAMLHYTYVIF